MRSIAERIFLSGLYPIGYNSCMIYPLQTLKVIDYLVIGHITIDITPNGPALGGTASYAALTAQALGLRVGIVTSWGNELPTIPLNQIPIISYPSLYSTTFENIQDGDTRIQNIRHIATTIDLNLVPDPWKSARIVHLGPVAQEVEPTIVRGFTNSFIGITPQGWLRTWNQEGRILPSEWPEASYLLTQVGATVISLEDVAMDEKRIDEMAAYCHILAVTEADLGSRVYWNGDVRRFNAPKVAVVDATGAGDIYAAAFFIRLNDTHDPWEAGRFATQLASISVSRQGLVSIPQPEEIQETTIEVF